MTYQKIKEAASSIDWKRSFDLANKMPGGSIVKMINGGALTEDSFNKGINEERLAAIVAFVEVAHHLNERILHTFKTRDELASFADSHNCGLNWYDSDSDMNCIYEYVK